MKRPAANESAGILATPVNKRQARGGSSGVLEDTPEKELRTSSGPASSSSSCQAKPLADNSASSEGSGVRGNASPEKQTEEEVATNIDDEDSGVHKHVDDEGSGVQETEEIETEQKEKHEDKQDQNNSEQEKKTIVEEDN